METNIGKIEIGVTIQLELKSKTPITFGKFGGGTEEIGLTYTGKLVEKKWSKSKEDYKLKFMDDDGTFTYFFEGAIDRQYNIVKVL
jgi:hypothetical protein